MPARKRLRRVTGIVSLRDARLLSDGQLSDLALSLTYGTVQYDAVQKEMKRRGIW